MATEENKVLNKNGPRTADKASPNEDEKQLEPAPKVPPLEKSASQELTAESVLQNGDLSSVEPPSSARSTLQAEILNWKKEKVAEHDLPKGFFQQKVQLPLINEVVRWQRAKARQGTHKAKTRGDVRGGGKKPFRQKGTGNARQGSIRSPLNRGGGVTFGPKPRDYTYTLPRKIRREAFWQALSHLWENKKIVVLEDMKSPEGKTKELYQRLKVFGYKKALLVDKAIDPLLKRAGNNLKFFPLLPVRGLNVYDMLRCGHLMMSQRALVFLIEKYKEEYRAGLTESEKARLRKGTLLKKP